MHNERLNSKLRAPARVALLMIAGALVSACASYERDHVIVGSVPDDYRTRHPIVVAESEVAEDIVVPAYARKLSNRDRGVVEAFAARFRQSGTRAVALMIPAGSRNEAAARRIALEVAYVLKDHGVAEERIVVQHYSAAGHGQAATVRLVYTDFKAHVASRCGQWSEDIAGDSENRNYANFGCATQHNLAAMIANPADLLGPRGETPIDATRRGNVINDWQENGPRDLPRFKTPVIFGE